MEREGLTTSATSETFSFTVLAVTEVERKVRMVMEVRVNMVGRWRRDMAGGDFYMTSMAGRRHVHQRIMINAGNQVGM